jgi:hypothetical protein
VFAVLAASTIGGALAAGVGCQLACSPTSSRRWVEAVASTTPETNDIEDRATLEVLRDGVEAMLVSWFGLAVLIRAGCHAWSRLLVNASRSARGRPLLASSRLLSVTVSWRAVYGDAASDTAGRLLAAAAGTALFLALPDVPWSRPFLAAVYGSQGLFLVADGLAYPIVRLLDG